MKLLRSTWHVSLWCTRKGCLAALWSLWLLMLATAGLQFYVIRTPELSLPGPVRRLIERRLAEQGFEVTFARATFDFSGRILLEKVALGPSSTPTPLVTARSVYLELTPWELAFRNLDVRKVSASGVELHLPAMTSASGKDETLARDVNLTLIPQGRLIQINHFTGRVDGLSITASGSLRLPVTQGTSASSASIDEFVAAYLRLGRQVPEYIARLSALEAPTLDIELDPADNRIANVRATLRAASANLSGVPQMRDATTGALTINAELVEDGESLSPIRGDGRIASIDVPGLASVQDMRFDLLALQAGPVAPFTLRRLDVQLASMRAHGIDVGPTSALLTPPKDGALAADISTTMAGSPWRIATRLDLKNETGRVELDGWVDGALLGLAGVFAKHDLAALLGPAVPAALHASADFLPGWKLQQAEGRLHSGPVRVGDVHLDETGTEFTYRDDGRVLCDNLVLRQGESLAHGLYEMDAKTMDFRFLLTGGLRPNGIAGWFHDWWTHFWNDFDFSKSVPQADVDVAGRWGNLEATRVFVQAEGGATGLRGAPFDKVSTRLFVRPQWDDILYFKVAQGTQEAAGTFARLSDLEKNTWSRMDFSIDSSLSLATMEQLFGKDASVVFAPYKFANAPQLKLAGHVESPVWPGGAHQNIDIGLTSTGVFAFHGFPLSDLVFTARLQDGIVDIPALSLGFADGRVTGSAKVWGKDNDRRVSLNATMTNANLGAAIRAINLTPEAKANPGEKTLSQRLENGHLNFTLNAEGPYGDFYGFTGTGSAEITGADLGQINLFGILSELLRETVVLNFSSFSLDTLNTQFVVDGPRVTFGVMKISGPTAAIDAKGDYGLRDRRLDFKAKIFPFEENKSLVLSPLKLVLSPFSNALELKLQGTLAKPDWVFTYGPTSLLRSLIGNPTAPAVPTNP